MKKMYLNLGLAYVLSISIISSVLAEEPGNNSLILTGSNLSALFDSPLNQPSYLAYERKLPGDIGMYGGLSIFEYSTVSSISDSKQTKQAFIVGMRKYLNVIDGNIFLDLSATYEGDVVGITEKTETTRTSIRPKIGYQYFLSPRFSIQTKAGFKYAKTKYNPVGGSSSSTTYTFPSLEFGLGLHW